MQKGPWAGTNLVRLGQSYTIAEENKGLTWYPNIGIRWYPGLSGPRTNPAGIKDEIQHFSGSHRICLRAEYVYKEHTCTNIYIYIDTPLFILINDN